MLTLSSCSNRIPEAALMARSYLPSKVSEIVAIWRKDLNKVIFNSYVLLMLNIPSTEVLSLLHIWVSWYIGK